MESVGPQKLLNTITKSPNQTLIKEAAISEVLHLGVDLKTKSKNVSGNVLLLSSMLWAWMLPRVVERVVHMTLELHAAAVQGEAWSIWGSCYSRRKAVPQE